MEMKINSGKTLRSRSVLNGWFVLGQLTNFIIKSSYNVNPLKMLLLTLNDLTVKRVGKYHSCGVNHG